MKKNIRLVRKADGDCVEEVVPADEAKQQVDYRCSSVRAC